MSNDWYLVVWLRALIMVALSALSALSNGVRGAGHRRKRDKNGKSLSSTTKPSTDVLGLIRWQILAL